jgi:hypothetical protein
MYYEYKYLLSDGVLIDFVISMEKHAVEDDQWEEEKMPTNPMVSISTLGKKPYINIFKLIN